MSLTSTFTRRLTARRSRSTCTSILLTTGWGDVVSGSKPAAGRTALRWRSDGTTTKKPVATSLSENASASDRQAYLHAANAEMFKYHVARERMRAGQLPTSAMANAPPGGGRSGGAPRRAHHAQLAVAGLFVLAFMATPFIGKKIAYDHEFRQRYIPTWYDYTVPQPERPWTRAELHEQMVTVQRELRERAIRGDFAPDKLASLEQDLRRTSPAPVAHPSRLGRANSDAANESDEAVPEAWKAVHPGMAPGESVNEE